MEITLEPIRVTKEMILKKVSQEQLMEHYLGIPVKKGLFKSPLRKDKNPTCSFYWNKNGDLGIATRIIGQNLALTPNELKRIEAAKSATPTNMASQADTAKTLDSMSENLGIDNDDDNDLPF